MRRFYVRVDTRIGAAIDGRLAAVDHGHPPIVEQIDQVETAVGQILAAVSQQHARSRQARRVELALRAELDGLRPQLDGLRGELNGLRASSDAVHAALGGGVAGVEQRLEFVRREVLYELTYGRVGGASQAAVDIEPKIVTPERVAAMSGAIRLNLGAGHIPIDGYLNVDRRDLDGIDIVAEVGNLPFAEGEVREIYSAHLLEHFPVEELRRRLLPYWFALLEPGGALTAVVPDTETMLAEHAGGTMSFDDLREVLFGAQEYEGDSHFNAFSKASLCRLLEEVGFAEVRIRADGRRNGMCFEMEVEARRPGRAPSS